MTASAAVHEIGRPATSVRERLPETEPPTLATLARETLAKHDGIVDKATVVLTARLMRNKKLLAAVTEAAIRDAVDYHVRYEMRAERSKILQATAGPGRAGVFALANGITLATLDFQLTNGQRLRHATRADVSEQAARYEGLSQDTGRKAKWLGLIAAALPNGKRTVGEVMSDERAAELWREAE